MNCANKGSPKFYKGRKFAKGLTNEARCFAGGFRSHIRQCRTPTILSLATPEPSWQRGRDAGGPGSAKQAQSGTRD
jgi:hypothetical protein